MVYQGSVSLMKKESQSKQSAHRHSREEWLERALEILSREGNARLRIDRLAESMGVTKGSFYWHFKNRRDFIIRLVNYWADSSTAPVIEAVNRVGGTPQKRLYALMEFLWRKDFAKYDVCMRAWAAQESEVATIVRRVDKQRMEYVGSLFKEMGFTGQELEMRTRTFVGFHSLEHGILTRGSKKERRKLLKLRHAFFTKR
jgi:AcrR family transcriptional regulator